MDTTDGSPFGFRAAPTGDEQMPRQFSAEMLATSLDRPWSRTRRWFEPTVADSGPKPHEDGTEIAAQIEEARAHQLSTPGGVPP